MSKLLRSQGISKHFGQFPVLSDVSFSVYSGEILGIIGPNGAGKTTLMECITGLLAFDQGQLYWRGQALAACDAKQFMFYLPDGVLPYAEQRVERVLAFFQQLYGAKPRRVKQLLQRLELAPMLTKSVHSLSKGYRRRLLLLIALLSPQPLLMLDEPFDGFDLRQTLGVMELLRENLASRALLLSIHQLTEAEKICDRFLLLNAGEVAALGSLSQLQHQTGLQSACLEEVFLAIV